MASSTMETYAEVIKRIYKDSYADEVKKLQGRKLDYSQFIKAKK